MPCLSENAEIFDVEVDRLNCINDMFKIYSNPDVLEKKLNVSFKDELGVDGGGLLTKELFNIFFKEIEGIYLIGEECLIPYLELNKLHDKDKFIIIGRILQHMLLLTGMVPSKLSRIMLMLISDPEKEFDQNIILKELLAYVNPCLRYILKKGLENFDHLNEKEKTIIQDFFQTNKFFSLANATKFPEQLSTIGNEVIIEKPRRLIDLIRKGVLLEKYDDFWKKCDFDVLQDTQKPTAVKVANCLVTDENLTNEESDVLHYFEMYIRCLNNEDVAQLFFLITGSFLMPNTISVKFSDLVGLARRPMFSTCTDTITLPKTYENYNDLKNDLNICLRNDDAKMYNAY